LFNAHYTPADLLKESLDAPLPAALELNRQWAALMRGAPLCPI
jgi:hypothetical protein